MELRRREYGAGGSDIKRANQRKLRGYIGECGVIIGVAANRRAPRVSNRSWTKETPKAHKGSPREVPRGEGWAYVETRGKREQGSEEKSKVDGGHHRTKKRMGFAFISGRGSKGNQCMMRGGEWTSRKKRQKFGNLKNT